MLAVKATYDNGTVEWTELPKVGGRHTLIVIFEDIDARPEKQPASMAGKQAEKGSWRGFADLVGCVAERSDGADRHDDYLAGADKS